MTDYVLTIPEDVYQRARQLAEAADQPVDQVIIDYLRTLPPRLPTLAADEERELEALNQLSDDTLWTIAREQLPDEAAQRLTVLMAANSRGTITPTEYGELERLVERGDRLMVRKSEAAALLTRRGYTVSTHHLLPDE